MFEKTSNVSDVMAASCVLAANKLSAGGIVVINDTTGDVTRLISKYRPSIPVLAIVDNVKVARQLTIHRSVYPTLLPQHKAMAAAVEEGLLDSKDNVIIVNVRFHFLLVSLLCALIPFIQSHCLVLRQVAQMESKCQFLKLHKY